MADVFVFGSNRQGIHGKGAARTAFDKFGAVWGCGEGFFGRSYAIPTKITPYTYMSMELIREHIYKFLDFAQAHPEHTFYVTQIGCGFAGKTRAQIAPNFIGCPPNCLFDPAWEMWGLKVWDKPLDSDYKKD